MKRYYSQKGFTLIELLIVIVIIAILAAVVIGVLNPVQQQNRARDGVIRSNISKMVMAGKSLQVSTARANKAPTLEEFIAAIGNVASGHTCSGAAATCAFTVVGVPLPTTCSGQSGQCQFTYWRGTNAFRVAARLFSGGDAAGMIVYEYAETSTGSAEQFYSCPAAFNVASDALSSCTVLE